MPLAAVLPLIGMLAQAPAILKNQHDRFLNQERTLAAAVLMGDANSGATIVLEKRADV
jgi:hypothetical protein